MAGTSLSDLFERTWRERSKSWRAYALRLTGDPADADDVVLEAATRTLQTDPSLDTEGRLHAYVTTAIRHLSFEVVRKRRRETGLDEQHTGPHRSYASSALQLALSSEASARRKTLAAGLERELRRLAREDRQIIRWMVLRTPPLKLREVAERQGVATSTVHYRFNRALRSLAESLAGEESATRAGR